jgi:hypothetical protein
MNLDEIEGFVNCSGLIGAFEYIEVAETTASENKRISLE